MPAAFCRLLISRATRRTNGQIVCRSKRWGRGGAEVDFGGGAWTVTAALDSDRQLTNSQQRSRATRSFFSSYSLTVSQRSYERRSCLYACRWKKRLSLGAAPCVASSSSISFSAFLTLSTCLLSAPMPGHQNPALPSFSCRHSMHNQVVCQTPSLIFEHQPSSATL